jgi:hypothetical protein
MKTQLFYFLLIVLFCGCATTKSSQSYSPAPGNMSSGGTNTGSVTEMMNDPERVIVYNANLDMVIKNPDSINVRIARIAKRYEGYVQEIGNRYTVIRVLAANLNNAVTDICALGKVREKSIHGQDVTDEYTDLNIRLDNAEKARTRYLELLNKAQNVGETLQVEKELERLNTEIDILKGKIGRISHLKDYSTITIQLREKVKPGLLGYVFIGLYKGIGWLFVR